MKLTRLDDVIGPRREVADTVRAILRRSAVLRFWVVLPAHADVQDQVAGVAAAAID